MLCEAWALKKISIIEKDIEMTDIAMREALKQVTRQANKRRNNRYSLRSKNYPKNRNPWMMKWMLWSFIRQVKDHWWADVNILGEKRYLAVSKSALRFLIIINSYIYWWACKNHGQGEKTEYEYNRKCSRKEIESDSTKKKEDVPLILSRCRCFTAPNSAEYCTYRTW